MLHRLRLSLSPTQRWTLAALGLGALSITAFAIGEGRDRLREIVQQQCVPHWLSQHDPAPCYRVSIDARPAAAAARGYVILPDRKGGAHYLLIPIEPVSGIESPAARTTQAPNYFQDAWEARDALAQVLGYVPPREDIGLAINSRYSRSQDQLHIHIECIGEQLQTALAAVDDTLGERWTPIMVGELPYHARRVVSSALGFNPFALLASQLPDAADAMDHYTLIVIGAQFHGSAGFMLLAGRGVPGGESLLDARCAVASGRAPR
jgi:CDP-diacylglycerol pyrophosphatase